MEALSYSLAPRWSQKLQAEPAGLCLAREAGWLLAWDQSQWLYILNQKGVVQAQARSESPISACAASDDGSAVVVAGKDGHLTWLTPDLRPCWQQRRPHPLLAIALDPFGLFTAAADGRGAIHIVDREGQKRAEVAAPRPLHHLAFVPTRPSIVGCADYGLAGAFTLDGTWTWREGIVSNLGSLTVNHDGSTILLASFSDGLQRFTMEGTNLGRLATPEPCRFVAQSFDGVKTLIGGLTDQLFVVDRQGQVVARHKLDQPFHALTLGPLGEVIYAACPGIGVIQLKVKKRGTEMH